MKNNKKFLSIYALSAAMILTACGVSTPNAEGNASYDMDGMSFVDGIVGNKDFGRIQRADNESVIENLTSEFKDTEENEYVSKAQYQINSVDDTNSIRFVAAAKVDDTEDITYGFHVSYKSGDTTKNFFAPVTNFYNSFVAGGETYTNDKSSLKTDSTKTIADFVGSNTTGYTHFIALTIYDIPKDYLNTTFTVTASYKTSGKYYDSGDVRYTSYKKTSLLEGNNPFVLVNDNTSDIKAYSGTESMELKSGDVVSYYANGTSTPKITNVVNGGTYSTINYFAGKVNYISVTNVSLDSNDNKDKAYLKISGNYLRDAGTDELTVSDFLIGTCDLQTYQDNEWNRHNLSDVGSSVELSGDNLFTLSFDITDVLKEKSGDKYVKMFLHFDGDLKVENLKKNEIHLSGHGVYGFDYGKNYSDIDTSTSETSWLADLLVLQYSVDSFTLSYEAKNMALDEDGNYTLSGSFTCDNDNVVLSEGDIAPYFDVTRYNNGWNVFSSSDLNAVKTVDLVNKTWSYKFNMNALLIENPDVEYFFHFGDGKSNLKYQTETQSDLSCAFTSGAKITVYSKTSSDWTNGLLFTKYEGPKAQVWSGVNNAELGLDFASFESSNTDDEKYNVKCTQSKDEEESKEKIMYTNPNHDVSFSFYAAKDVDVSNIGIEMTWYTIWQEGERELFRFSLDGGDYSSNVTANYGTDNKNNDLSWELGYVKHGLEGTYHISKGFHTLTIHALEHLSEAGKHESYYSIVTAYLNVAE